MPPKDNVDRPRQLHLQVDVTAGQAVSITVADNGVGISEENLKRIFVHGFTTHADGHGFGLHSSALAAKEMGGTLTVHTDGDGTGAAFTLDVPLEAEEIAGMSTPTNRRILLIDDTPSIHEDFRRILSGTGATAEIDAAEEALFGEVSEPADAACFDLDSAHQGREGLEKVRASLEADSPYALAFVDMRMPPGWDGVETIQEIWKVDPRLQIVICTAHSDYSWDEVLGHLGVEDRLLILKKPFDNIEVAQLASALTAKWQMTRQAELKVSRLEAAVQEPEPRSWASPTRSWRPWSTRSPSWPCTTR